MVSELVGGLLAILAAVFSSIRYYFVRKATSPKGPINTVMVSLIVGSLFFIPASIILNYPNFELSKVGVLAFFAAGLLATLGFICLYESVRRIGASRSSPIIRGSLLIASLIAILFLGESVETLHLVGIILLFLGVALVSFGASRDNSDSKSILPLELILPLAAMVTIGFLDPIVSLGYAEGVPVTVGLAIQRLTAFAVLTLLFLLKGWHPLRPFRTQERSLYFGAAIAVTFFVVCLYLALSIAPVVVVTPLRGMDPLFVLILSHFYLKKLEKITKILVIGVILTVLGGILVGVFL